MKASSVTEYIDGINLEPVRDDAIYAALQERRHADEEFAFLVEQGAKVTALSDGKFAKPLEYEGKPSEVNYIRSLLL